MNSNKKNNINNKDNVIEKNIISNNNTKNIIQKNKEDIINFNNNIDKFLEKSLSENTFKELTNQVDKSKEKEKDKEKDNNLIKENYKIIKNPEKNLNIEIEDSQKKKDYNLYNLDNEEDEEEEEEEDDEEEDKKKDSLCSIFG